MTSTPVPTPPPAPPPDTPLDADHIRSLFHEMLRIRRFEERCVELYSAEHIRGFMHLGIGQEAIPVGVMRALGPDDAVVATYREHGHAIARGVSEASVMAEMYGRVEGASRGRGGSMHIFDAASHFYGGNAIVAGGLPVAAGLALAARMQSQPLVVACFFGEGAVAEGEFHETMNLAALWQLPVLFCCENNLYAMGTALDRSEANTDLVARAAGYGIESSTVDGMDVLAVEAAARAAGAQVREGVPAFLELRTYRFRAHSMYDPERYRSKEEVEHWREHDPLDVLSSAPAAAGCLDPEWQSEIEATVSREVDAAVDAAEAGSDEPVEDLTRFVTSEVTS